MKKFDIELASHQEMVAHVKKLGLKLYTKNMDTKRLRETLRGYLKKPTRRGPRLSPVIPKKKYEVTIIREIEYRAVVEVEAESGDVAKQMAENMADMPPHYNYWREGDTLSQTVKVKVIS